MRGKLLLAAKCSGIEVRERETSGRICKGSQWTGNRRTRLIRPGLKMHRFGRAYADQNSKDLHTRCSLRHRRIETVAALFNGRHVKRRRVCDRLYVFVGVQVRIGSGDSGVWSRSEIWHSLGELETRIEIGVVAIAAVASPPTSVESKLSEIRKPLSDHGRVDSSRSAAF